jgi:hypothetical protein
LVLYDAEGDFDRNFDWWKESGEDRLVAPRLPFKNGRSDLLTGSGSRLDIANINSLATLLVHAQYQGYWNQLGMQFQEEMEALLEQHPRVAAEELASASTAAVTSRASLEGSELLHAQRSKSFRSHCRHAAETRRTVICQSRT